MAGGRTEAGRVARHYSEMPSAAGRGQGKDRRPDNEEQPAADVGLRWE